MTDDAQVVAMFSWIEASPDLGKVDACIANAGFSVSASLMDGQLPHDRVY